MELKKEKGIGGDEGHVIQSDIGSVLMEWGEEEKWGSE